VPLLYWLDATDSGSVRCADELDKKATKLLQTATIQGLTLDERRKYNEETVRMRKASQNTHGQVLYAEYSGITEGDCQEEALRWLTARGTKQAGDNKKWQACASTFGFSSSINGDFGRRLLSNCCKCGANNNCLGSFLRCCGQSKEELAGRI